jgi:hypothetical protein
MMDPEDTPGVLLAMMLSSELTFAWSSGAAPPGGPYVQPPPWAGPRCFPGP